MNPTDAPSSKAKPTAVGSLKSDLLAPTSVTPPHSTISKTVEESAHAGSSLSLTQKNDKVNAKNVLADTAPIAVRNTAQPMAKTTKNVTKTVTEKPVRGAGSENAAAQGNVVSMGNKVIKETEKEVRVNVQKTNASMNAAVKSSSDTGLGSVFSGLENARKMAQHSADTLARVWGESMTLRQSHMDACAEAGSLAAEVASKLTESAMHYAHETMAENVDISKDVFACRTASDMLALQNRLAQSNIHRFLNESARCSNAMFNFISRASEPFSENLADAGKRVSDALKK
jgi:hypothetical protein